MSNTTTSSERQGLQLGYEGRTARLTIWGEIAKSQNAPVGEVFNILCIRPTNAFAGQRCYNLTLSNLFEVIHVHLIHRKYSYKCITPNLNNSGYSLCLTTHFICSRWPFWLIYFWLLIVIYLHTLLNQGGSPHQNLLVFIKKHYSMILLTIIYWIGDFFQQSHWYYWLMTYLW